MKIILKERVANLGDLGEVVEVADGYARNYLIPQGKAAFAREGQVRRLAHQQRLVEKKKAVLVDEASTLAKKLEGLSISFKRAVAEGEKNKIFGSVTNRDIAGALAEEGVDVDRRKVQLKEPIKALGAYDVPVSLFGGVQAAVKVFVVQE
jgi:large subunit ribosomal protein L9